MKIYISGPIAGVPDYHKRFDAGARAVRRLGHTPVNPAWHPVGLTVREYMRRDLMDLLDSDAVLMLPGWENSGGALVERALAQYLGMEIYYSPDGIPDQSEPEI